MSKTPKTDAALEAHLERGNPFTGGKDMGNPLLELCRQLEAENYYLKQGKTGKDYPAFDGLGFKE